MSTFMLKNSATGYTPVSNIFIDKYMPRARGEYIKVYLLMLKYSASGELGVSSNIIANNLNLLESDIINALNYWNEEGVIKFAPIDKVGNFNIEFVPLEEEASVNDSKLNLLDALTSGGTKEMLKEIEKLLARPLSSKEMSSYLSWEKDFNFSSELILLLVEYCVSKGKSDTRYIEKVAISWHEAKIASIEEAQQYIKKSEDKWMRIRKVLSYLGIKNTEIMKPQEDMMDKWLSTYNFSLEVIFKACDICFERLNRADFKYIDGILNSWFKDNIKTLEDIALKDNKKDSTTSKRKVSPNIKNELRFNNFDQRVYDYDSLEKKLLGWDK
ncbi:DnaD domain protein [Alloiococcus sp. CFN-8]|uniref:DnaD domain protein n=1 Tax=Alloiococcus sp. CFN-8 TaxID=3416081 RepID=UPI003CE77875